MFVFHFYVVCLTRVYLIFHDKKIMLKIIGKKKTRKRRNREYGKMGKTCILINNKKLIINRQSRKLYYDIHILVLSSFRLSFYPSFLPTSCPTQSPRHSKTGRQHQPWKMTANRMNERVLIDSFSIFRIFHLIFQINQKQFSI